MEIMFDDLNSRDKVSFKNDLNGIKHFCIDFYTDDGVFVLSLYIENGLANCISSSSLPPNWFHHAETINRALRFTKVNGLRDKGK